MTISSRVRRLRRELVIPAAASSGESPASEVRSILLSPQKWVPIEERTRSWVAVGASGPEIAPRQARVTVSASVGDKVPDTL